MVLQVVKCDLHQVGRGIIRIALMAYQLCYLHVRPVVLTTTWKLTAAGASSANLSELVQEVAKK